MNDPAGDEIRVLHVDDEPAFLDLTGEYLARLDDRLALTTAERVDDALEILAADPIDCVVSDYDLADADGLEFLESVRERHGDLPFILFTGKGSEEIASRAIGAGVTDYLQKRGSEAFELLANRIEGAVARHRAEASYREIFEKAVHGIVVHHSETGRVLDVNERFAEIVGREVEELRGTEVAEFTAEFTTTPDDAKAHDADAADADAAENADATYDQAQALAHIREAAESGSTTFEWPVERPDGERRWVEVTLQRTTLDGEDRVLAMVRDVDERRRREQALERSRERFRALFDHAADILIVHDADGEIRDVNDRAIESLGYDRADLVGRPVTDIEVGVDADELRERWAEIPVGESWVVTGEHRRADGSTVPVEVHVSKFDIEGEPRFLAQARDVTERRQKEAELRAERDQFAALFENVPEPAVEVRQEAGEPIVLSVNPAFEAVFGFAEDELRGESLDDFIIPPGERDSAEKINRRVFTEGELEAEARRMTTDGVRDFLLRLAPVGDDLDRGFGVYMDITEQKEREREIRRQNERLEEFASIVSHDLRNPLHAATGRFELARQDCESPHFEGLGDALERMDALIEDLLALARQGRTIDDPEPVDLAGTARRAWDTAAVDDATLDLDEDLGTVMSDRQRLRQLLENLFRNAAEHNDGPVTVTLERTGEGAPAGFVVADDGDGLPDGDNERIFESGYTTAEDGTGFGLAIVEEIVEAHGWTIEAGESGDGGAAFWIHTEEGPP